MTPSLSTTNVPAGRAPQPDPRTDSSIEDELAVVAEELAAVRVLQATFDPDSPPWSVEGELRRLELRMRVLAAPMPPPPSPGGGTQRATDSDIARRSRVSPSAMHTRAG